VYGLEQELILNGRMKDNTELGAQADLSFVKAHFLVSFTKKVINDIYFWKTQNTNCRIQL
jgi:hypothetical protein